MLYLLYFLLLIAYTVFSYGLTTPNLTLLNQAWFAQFQNYMWATLFNNRSLTVKVYLGLIVGLFLIYNLIVKKIKAKQTISKKKLLTYFILVSPLVIAVNALSQDIFNYIFNAKMVLFYQANPHVQTAIQFNQDPWVRFMHNIHTPAPYWYGWTIFSLLPFSLGFGKFLPTWLSFKIFSLISLVLLGLSLRFLAKKTKHGLSFKNLALLFLNPLLIIEVLANGHNDLWMLVPAIFSLGLVIEPVGWWQLMLSALLLFMSVSTKLASLALIPLWLFFVLAWRINLLKSLKTWVKSNLGLVSSLLLFLPLVTSRSQQFHPWYLTWSLVWLPLIKNKVWKTILIVFSFTSLLRYLPWLLTNQYSSEILAQQKMITWSALPIALVILGLNYFKQLNKHHSK